MQEVVSALIVPQVPGRPRELLRTGGQDGPAVSAPASMILAIFLRGVDHQVEHTCGALGLESAAAARARNRPDQSGDGKFYGTTTGGARGAARSSASCREA